MSLLAALKNYRKLRQEETEVETETETIDLSGISAPNDLKDLWDGTSDAETLWAISQRAVELAQLAPENPVSLEILWNCTNEGSAEERDIEALIVNYTANITAEQANQSWFLRMVEEPVDYLKPTLDTVAERLIVELERPS